MWILNFIHYKYIYTHMRKYLWIPLISSKAQKLLEPITFYSIYSKEALVSTIVISRLKKAFFHEKLVYYCHQSFNLYLDPKWYHILPMTVLLLVVVLLHHQVFLAVNVHIRALLYRMVNTKVLIHSEISYK